ncbi:hypothetical protein P5673_008230, partial [Acropora cervicornis]
PFWGPYIESIESVDYNSIRLRWSKLHKEEAWEILRGYRIHIFKAYFNGSQPFYRKITVGPDVTAYYVTGLPTETHFSVSVSGFTAAATLVEDWNIVNISDVRTRSMHVEWSRYSLHSPFQVIVYTVVCTPTNDEVGSTLLNIKDTSIHKVDVGRLHFSTNYSVELVAFVNNSQTGEVSLRRSQKAYVVTLDP